MIIWLILIDVARDNVWILLGENWCWSLLGLKGLRIRADMRRLSVSALCKLSSLTIKWISLDHALFFFVLGKWNSAGQDEMRNMASLTQMLQPNFRRSVVMLCVTPNFCTNAYIERMYENPVKIQHIVWLRLLNTVYPIVTRSILRETWKVIAYSASSEMVKG